jgi:hypothetical protein
MADKMTNAQSPAAPAAIESKDDLIKGALVGTGELSDGALDQAAGGVRKAGGNAPVEYLKIKLSDIS